MATITYTAKRKLMDGHVAGEEYTFERALIEPFTPEVDDQKDEVLTLSGRQFTVLHRVDELFSLTFLPTDGADEIKQMDEWLWSVAAGEQFTIDLFGTEAAPDNPLTVKKVGSHQKRLNSVVGDYIYSLKVRAQ